MLLCEDAEGVVAFEYDRPASLFGQFGDDQVDLVAGLFDETLQSTLQAAASQARMVRRTALHACGIEQQKPALGGALIL